MRSRLPKVMHELAGKPLLWHPLNTLAALSATPPVAVISPGQPEVAAIAGECGRVIFQPQPAGTGDAMRCALEALPARGTVLVCYGDMPLVRVETWRRVLEGHRQGGADATLLSVSLTQPHGYARVLRKARGGFVRLVEEKDASPEQRQIQEVNSGAYAFELGFLRPALAALEPNPVTGELYLTDILASGAKVEVVQGGEIEDGLGVNDRVQLAQADAVLRQRLLEELMRSGVTVRDPASTFVEVGVTVGRDSVLEPRSHLRGSTVVGEDCVIGPEADLRDCDVGDRCHISRSVLEEVSLAAGCSVGPYSRLRPGTRLEAGASVGSFSELKNSRLGRDSKVPHLSYVGDARIGDDVNVGAGTITCNYDGFSPRKHATTIGDGAFIGSDTMLVAPVTIGAGAYTATGSVITRDVPDGALAISRMREQHNVAGWVPRRKARERATSPGEAVPPSRERLKAHG